MGRWAIERFWTRRSDSNPELLSTTALQSYKACVLLGTAGLGKTYELRQLTDLDRAHCTDVRCRSPIELGFSLERLESALAQVSDGMTHSTVLHLDALDELMVAVPAAGTVLTGWVHETIARTRASIRIVCRSAVWPRDLEQALKGVYEPSDMAIVDLNPLSNSDVRTIASSRGIDGEAFLHAITVAGASTLARHPLTLEMLLDLFATNRCLPSRRSELFREGVYRLAREREERREGGTAGCLPAQSVLDICERLACFLISSGRDTVDWGDRPDASSISGLELEGLSEAPISDEMLRAVRRTGLVEGDGPTRLRFAHKQLAEYLAGRLIGRLPLHTARGILASPKGWTNGVSGPLRETAAFAAAESDAIAKWIADCDPEIVGMSDVSDDSLRHMALRSLAAKCRCHAVTDRQLRYGGLALSGLAFEGCEPALAELLTDRSPECVHLIALAVSVIEQARLGSMSEALAELFLDPSAPHPARVWAGYVLLRVGSQTARIRMLPLTRDTADDPHQELKGLALTANWPDGMTEVELLRSLTVPSKRGYIGAYSGFLMRLAESDFVVAGDRVAQLAWAIQRVDEGPDSSAFELLVHGIARAACLELDNCNVAVALARLLLASSSKHERSPLHAPTRLVEARGNSTPPPLSLRDSARRQLIRSLVDIAQDEDDFAQVLHENRLLCNLEDFPWLLKMACDEQLNTNQRQRFGYATSFLPWEQSVECIDLWLSLRHSGKLPSALSYPTQIELDSVLAREAKAHADRVRALATDRAQRGESLEVLRERLDIALHRCESTDSRYFWQVCHVVSMEPGRRTYDLQRVLVSAPGWLAANAQMRGRIVGAAKKLLGLPLNDRSVEPNSQLATAITAALWLVMDQDPDWIAVLPADWWAHTARALLLGLHPHYSEESGVPKAAIVDQLYHAAPEAVRNLVCDLATDSDDPAMVSLSHLLDVIGRREDALLDARLCSQVRERRVSESCMGRVAHFALSRAEPQARAALCEAMVSAADAGLQSLMVRVAVSLLNDLREQSWDPVLSLIEAHPPIARDVLLGFAHGRGFHCPDENPRTLWEMSPKYIGRLAEMLMEAFPPESDTERESGEAYWETDTDAAANLRSTAVSRLSAMPHPDALASLRRIEAKHGSRYPGLRRVRADAERALRLSTWSPMPLPVIAEVLHASGRRLIRGEQDALDGIIAALEQYGQRLLHHSPPEVEDLWDTPRGAPPTPKLEERVSDKVCEAIRGYFREYAVYAAREAQLRRRLAPKPDGLPGSRTDVLAGVPGPGTLRGDLLQIPIEIKFAHNSEAKTALADQLVNRYMSELGVTSGVYVVVWMGRDVNGKRARWENAATAREDLQRQVEQLRRAHSELDIRIFVLEAQLSCAM